MCIAAARPTACCCCPPSGVCAGCGAHMTAPSSLVSLLRPLPRPDLESLFIQSEEVRKELPEATQRFAKIDR